MKNKTFITLLIILSLSAFTILQTTHWKAKEDYSVRWDKTSFKGLKATILFDEEHPEKSKISATIDAKTVETGNSLKNRHTRQALDTDHYPLIAFISTSVKSLGNSRYEAVGHLMIKGVTKEIKLPFVFDNKNMAESFSGVITIAPKDFNITRMGTPDVVTVQLSVPVTK